MVEDKLVPSLTPIDEASEKKLLRKCDLHVVPIISMLYVLSFLDRINIGNARIQGLEKDLNMSGQDYNVALMVFFIPYILFEVPSNILIRKIRPSTWLSLLMMAWGAIIHNLRVASGDLAKCWLGTMTICMGITRDFTGLLICRTLLGLFEAGFFPGISSKKTVLNIRGTDSDLGCLYLMSMYYRRYELQKRFTFFFCSAILAGAFSGVCLWNQKGVN